MCERWARIARHQRWVAARLSAGSSAVEILPNARGETHGHDSWKLGLPASKFPALLGHSVS